MEEFITNWTKEELNLYILIFCANADFIESKGETDFLKLKSNETLFSRIHEEFDKDNDYQSIQKIRSTLDKFGYTKDEKDLLLREMKELFFLDGTYNILEKNLFIGMNHIFGDNN